MLLNGHNYKYYIIHTHVSIHSALRVREGSSPPLLQPQQPAVGNRDRGLRGDGELGLPRFRDDEFDARSNPLTSSVLTDDISLLSCQIRLGSSDRKFSLTRVARCKVI